MSFGFSASDFVLLVQLAHKTFRNCQKAGEEYVEIACEVRCLHSVLRTLRTESQKPESRIFRQDPASTKQLIATADGCKNVLDSLDFVLAKYEGLKSDGQASAGKKLWQKFRFGSKAEELGVIRGKLVTYTSTMSILIDTMQIQASDRVEGKIDDGFTEVIGQFERMRKEIYLIASQKRAEERAGASISSLSLSTYAGDEKAVWQDFRRELVKKGFRSQSLDKHKLVLEAYMLQLDQSTLLDQDRMSRSDPAPWWTRKLYLQTVNSLTDLQPIGNPARQKFPMDDVVGTELERGTVAPKFHAGAKIHETGRNIEKRATVRTPPNIGCHENSINRKSKPPCDADSTHLRSHSKEVDIQESHLQSIKPACKALISFTYTTGKQQLWFINIHGKMVPPTLWPTFISVNITVKNSPGCNRQAPVSVIRSIQDTLAQTLTPGAMRLQIQAELRMNVGLELASVVAEEIVYESLWEQDTHRAMMCDEGPERIRKRVDAYRRSRRQDVSNMISLLETLSMDGDLPARCLQRLPKNRKGLSFRQPVAHFDPSPKALSFRRPFTNPGQQRHSTQATRSLKGILRYPTLQFPEDINPIREGVAPHKDAKMHGVPADARWTKINRRLVCPEVLEARNERYEAREDFVLVLRVLSAAEIKDYAARTKEIKDLQERKEVISQSNGSSFGDTYTKLRIAARLKEALQPVAVDWYTVKIDG